MKIVLTGNKRRYLFYAVVMTGLAFCAFRGIDAYRKNSVMVDLTGFIATANAAWNGLDFYDLDNLSGYYTEIDKNHPAIEFPGMLLFYIPLTFIDIEIVRPLYYTFNLLGAVFIFVMGFKITGLLKNIDFKNPNLNTAVFFIAWFLFFNSSPVLMCLRHGQQMIWITLTILFFFSCGNRYAKIILFGLGTLLKYSMVTLFAPMLFLKKQYFICVAAFILFVCLSLFPVLLGYNPFELYRQYIGIVKDVMSSGNVCSFQGSGYNMLQIDFFIIPYLNTLGKIAIAAIILPIMWNERGKEEFSLNLLLLLFCFSMLLSYHRLYDNVIVLLFLLIKTHFLVLEKDWGNATVCAMFLGFFLIPFSWVLRVSNSLGTAFPRFGEVFHLCNFEGFTTLLPIPALMQLALSFYVLYLYFETDRGYVFKLQH